MVSHSLEDTKKIAKDFVATLQGGEVIGLRGELGSGKTTFVKAVAEALGVTDTLRSPTFTLLHVYPTAHEKIRSLVHADAYRLKRAEDIGETGLLEWLGRSDAVVCVEWPERLEGLLPETKTVRFAHGSSEEERIIVVE